MRMFSLNTVQLYTGSFNQFHTTSIYRSLSCPSASSQSSLDCMNRNKRKVNKANHGARPCNSVGRKSRGLYATQSWNVPRPNQTHNKVSTYVSESNQLKQLKKEQMKREWELKNAEKRKAFSLDD